MEDEGSGGGEWADKVMVGGGGGGRGGRRKVGQEK